MYDERGNLCTDDVVRNIFINNNKQKHFNDNKYLLLILQVATDGEARSKEGAREGGRI